MGKVDNLSRFIEKEAPIIDAEDSGFYDLLCTYVINKDTKETCGRPCYKEIGEKHGEKHACMEGHTC